MISPWSARSKYRTSNGALRLLWSFWSNVLKAFALFPSDHFCVKDMESGVLWSGLVIINLREFLFANPSYSTLLIFVKSWYVDDLPVISSSWVMVCLKALFLLHAHSLVLQHFWLCGLHQLGVPRNPSSYLQLGMLGTLSLFAVRYVFNKSKLVVELDDISSPLPTQTILWF